MCWNSTVSLNTFLFGLFSVLLALKNNIITIKDSLFYFSVISIQLIEYFTWKNINNLEKIKTLSIIALLLIFLQPALNLNSSYNGSHKKEILMIYLIFILYVIIKSNINFTMTKAPNGHLTWDWLKFPKMILLIWVLFLLLPRYNKPSILILYLFIIGLIYYSYYKSNTWGSMWCWFGSILSIILIIQVFTKDICTLPGGKLF